MTGAVSAMAGSGLGPSTLLGIIQELGLTTNLLLCLDAADSASYSGSGQVWLDRSGNGYDFNRGTTSGAEASDPTFNGVAGGLSHNEYWSYDGADLHSYDTTVEAWMNALHQDNAEFTCLILTFIPTGASSNWILGTQGNAPNDGIGLFADEAVSPPDATITLQVRNGAPTFQTSIAAISNRWNLYIAAIDEGVANGSTIHCNGTGAADFTTTYTTPSVNPAQPMKIGAVNGVSFANNGARIAMVAFWSTRQTNTALTNLYNRIKARRPGLNLP